MTRFHKRDRAAYRGRRVRRYFGSAAHFIGAESCRFHIATLIGKYVISTVGDYRPSTYRGAPGEYGEEIGLGRKYETMVFKSAGPCECGCGMPEIVPTELDMKGYNSRADANRGHEKMCRKYEALARKRPKGARRMSAVMAVSSSEDGGLLPDSAGSTPAPATAITPWNETPENHSPESP